MYYGDYTSRQLRLGVGFDATIQEGLVVARHDQGRLGLFLLTSWRSFGQNIILSASRELLEGLEASAMDKATQKILIARRDHWRHFIDILSGHVLKSAFPNGEGATDMPGRELIGGQEQHSDDAEIERPPHEMAEPQGTIRGHTQIKGIFRDLGPQELQDLVLHLRVRVGAQNSRELEGQLQDVMPRTIQFDTERIREAIIHEERGRGMDPVFTVVIEHLLAGIDRDITPALEDILFLEIRII